MPQKSNLSRINPNLVLIAILGIGAYFASSSILEALGIKKSKKETKEEKEAEKILDKQETKINIWQGTEAVKRAAGANSLVTLLNYSGAASKADNIYDSFGLTNDDEERIYASFRSLNAQTQVASIVDQYKIRHNADLLTTLKSKLNSSEFVELTKIIDAKPIGITKKQ
jgi:hypothetical protein